MKGLGMEDIKSYWPPGETLALWQRFASELTGKQVSIRIYKEYGDWKECLSRVVGLHPMFAGGACMSARNEKCTIHLYLPGNYYIEDRFYLFLHELAHIYLDHAGKREGAILEMEAEADGWVAVNFAEEIKTLERLMDWHQYGKEHESTGEQKAVSSRQKAAIRKMMGDWFFLTEEDKAPLTPWFQEVEYQLQWQISMNKRMKGVYERLSKAAQKSGIMLKSEVMVRIYVIGE